MKKVTSFLAVRSGFLIALIVVLTGSAIGQSGSSNQTSGRRDGMRFVPNVQSQFYYLTEHADPLGLHITTTPDPSTCRHYQGMVRAEGADGTPFFLVTRSGNTPDSGNETVCDDSPGETHNGHLIVFRMDSRDKNGERLRSNRLRKGVHVDSSAPVSLDRATIYFTFIGGDPDDPDPAKRPGLVLRDGPDNLPPRVYQHPGGMQLVGNIMAVALERPRPFGKEVDKELCGKGDLAACDRYLNYERAPDRTAIQFYDVSDPEAPVFKSQFVPKNSNGETLSGASVVGVTPLPNGRYLMVIAGGSSNNSWFFYRSNVDDLSSEDLTWEQVRSPEAPETEDPHQTLNFLREGSIEGNLYIAGARGRILADRDKIDLYKIVCLTANGEESPNCEPGDDITWTPINVNKPIIPRPSTDGKKLASLAAAATFYVSPSGELILYATEHDNDGPDATVKAGEWRHIDVVRPNSPTLLPSAKLDGPFVVDEGSSVNLTGSGQPPVTRAFLEMFTFRNEFLLKYLTADYKDQNRDDFDNLFAYEDNGGDVGNGDSGYAWVWFAPQGCSIQAINRDGETENIVGIKTLTNATTPQVDEDLKLVMNDAGTGDMFRNVDRITFGSDCGDYYAAPVNLFWDLDRDGTYEAQGNTAHFSAAVLDGPTVVQIPVEARHSLGGAPGNANAVVTVKNVAPQFSQFALVDSGGNPINSVVPWVLTGLPVGVAASFTDPGILDHQTAQLSWGDGASDPHTAFTAFDEAFGDGAGSLSHRHMFTAPGTYAVQLAIIDDDGDSDMESANVRVLTPEQAVIELIAMLDAVIASTTNTQALAELRQARHALTGSNENSHNGALKKIRSGENEAAAAFALTSATWLQRAAESGADVAVPIALLQQVAAALAA
ncbi:MAG TPA: PKD domain-containing protein [Blastocatellia bacterium]|nr:PKD domain-containing protein [Blastocatellia bacterium]